MRDDETREMAPAETVPRDESLALALRPASSVSVSSIIPVSSTCQQYM